jgi:hypothetical protein
MSVANSTIPAAGRDLHGAQETIVDANERPAHAPAGVALSACLPRRSQPERPSVLLASLQRVYGGDERPVADAPEPLNDTRSKGRLAVVIPSSSPYKSAIDLLETVFDVSELDPLPYVDHRMNPAAGENGARRDAPASSPGPVDTPVTAALTETANADRLRQQSAAPASERRRLPRRESDCAVLVRPYTGNERLSPEKLAWHLHSAKIKGHLVDVSMSGVALSLSEALTAGTRVVVRISNRMLDKHVDSAAMVLRCRREGESEYSVVCRFEKNLTFEQIHLIGRNLFASTIV